MRNVRPGKAFTLIELLVVVAIIALLIGILLPALSEARKTAMLLKSAANMAGQSKAFYAYANDFRDVFVNPYPADGKPQFPEYGPPASTRWDVFLIPDKELLMGLAADSSRVSEGFSMFWGMVMSGYVGHTAYGSLESFAAPLDKEVKDRVDAINRNYATGLDLNLLDFHPDTSYLYSPVFWTNYKRYQTTSPLGIQPIQSSPASGAQWIKHNRIDSVTFTAGKVLLWERGDFTKRSRSGPGGTVVPVSPSWLNPAAQIQTCTVAGNIVKIKMKELHKIVNSGTADEKGTYEPVGIWNPTSPTLPGFSPRYTTDQLWENNRGFRQFFWATRNGVRGRDFPNSFDR